MRDFLKVLGSKLKGVFLKEESPGKLTLTIPGWLMSLWAVFSYLVGFEFGITIVACLFWVMVIIMTLFSSFLLLGLLSESITRWNISTNPTKLRRSFIEAVSCVPAFVVLWLSGWTSVVIGAAFLFVLLVIMFFMIGRAIRIEKEKRDFINRGGIWIE